MPPVFAALVLFAAAATAAPPAPVQVKLKPAPPTLTSTLGAAGFGAPLRPLQGFTPLQGLPATGDTAPQCRAVCVKSRAICGDDAECGEQWRQCVVGCQAQAAATN